MMKTDFFSFCVVSDARQLSQPTVIVIVVVAVVKFHYEMKRNSSLAFMSLVLFVGFCAIICSLGPHSNTR